MSRKTPPQCPSTGKELLTRPDIWGESPKEAPQKKMWLPLTAAASKTFKSLQKVILRIFFQWNLQWCCISRGRRRNSRCIFCYGKLYFEFLFYQTAAGSSDQSMYKSRRHSINPVPLPDFLRRVSITQISRRMSLKGHKSRRKRSDKRFNSNEKMSSKSQPFLNRSFKRTPLSPHSGFDRTISMSGTFFRRTQRKLQSICSVSI